MRLPIQVLKDIGIKYDFSVVVVYAYSFEKNIHHVASWGKTISLCDIAAQWADKLKDALGWPESLHALPNRVKKYKSENSRLKSLLKEAYELSEYAACVHFDGSQNTDIFLKNLEEKIENFQKHYEEINHGEDKN
jgi:hypothetical protein